MRSLLPWKGSTPHASYSTRSTRDEWYSRTFWIILERVLYFEPSHRSTFFGIFQRERETTRNDSKSRCSESSAAWECYERSSIGRRTRWDRQESYSELDLDQRLSGQFNTRLSSLRSLFVVNSLLMSMRNGRKQKGNPVIQSIRSVPWEWGDVKCDYQVGPTTGVLFLS